jgi:hypothetical protein
MWPGHITARDTVACSVSCLTGFSGFTQQQECQWEQAGLSTGAAPGRSRDMVTLYSLPARVWYTRVHTAMACDWYLCCCCMLRCWPCCTAIARCINYQLHITHLRGGQCCVACCQQVLQLGHACLRLLQLLIGPADNTTTVCTLQHVHIATEHVELAGSRLHQPINP